ncbi:MAG: GGDEF domain-containing response regulator [bacterium]|nr:GGDEF domain-containing response regulator [bacterium]
MDQKQNILVVDDNESMLFLITELLKNNNTDILTSTTGYGGIELALHNKVDLIIMDVNLPDITGFDAVKKIREYKDNHEVQIIFLTGRFSDEDSLLKGLKVGGDDYLVQPISNEVLQAKVKTILLKQLLINEAIKDKKDTKDKKKELEKLLYLDSLTGTVNRNPFIDMLNKNISMCSRYQNIFGLLFLDFDGFKLINDKYGHLVGDIVLSDSVKRIKNKIRQYDIIGRFGGDEFLICLNDIKTNNDIITVANKINREFEKTFISSERLIDLGVSIGISTFPRDGKDAITLINNADTAMYRSKRNKKNGYEFFSCQDL